MEWDRDNPLARVPGETSKANRALLDYAQMSTARSLRELAEKYREVEMRDVPTTSANTIMKWSERYDWVARVARYDDILRERERAEYEAERLTWRKKRRQMAEGFFIKTARALGKIDVDDTSLAQLTNAVKTALAELRAEYDDLPTQRHEVEGSIIAIEVVAPSERTDPDR